MPTPTTPVFQIARVHINRALCEEHYRLEFDVVGLPVVTPGQFMHITPCSHHLPPRTVVAGGDGWVTLDATVLLDGALTFRRAFSVAGLQTLDDDTTRVAIIYRVVGKGTAALKRLGSGDPLDVLGPLGNGFTLAAPPRLALLVCGGVGLPPMLLLAEALDAAGVSCVAFCGVQRRNLLPLTFDESVSFCPEGHTPRAGAHEFDAVGTPIVVSSDDGSIGHHGRITGALTHYIAHHRPDAGTTRVYTCGPEAMMRAVSEICAPAGLACEVCMERSMACGMGTCQSCVVDVADGDPSPYALCCTAGPVFPAERIRWSPQVLRHG